MAYSADLLERIAGATPDLPKKSLNAAEQLRPDVAARRIVFLEQFAGVPLRDVVVLDESYSGDRVHAAARTVASGRTPCGPRAARPLAAADGPGHDEHQGHRRCRDDRRADGRRRVRVFVDAALVPRLRCVQVVVMDNLAAHKVAGVRRSSGPDAGSSTCRRTARTCRRSRRCGRR